MAWMDDDTYEYYQDLKDKKTTGNSARNRRGHTGKRGGMKTAADYMTQKQLRALDGEVKTYRMGSPMDWAEFIGMPDDLKKMYIKNLRKKFNVPDGVLASAMGVDIQVFTEALKSIRLGPNSSNGEDWCNTDECGRFHTWWIVEEEK